MTELNDIPEDKNIRYQRYRPKLYTPRMSIFWWAGKKPYVLFIIRELSSIFIAAYAVILMVLLYALHQGPEAYEALLTWFASPFSIVLHTVILLFVMYHSITWFKLAPRAMIIKIGKSKIPGGVIVTANIAGWIVLSAAIAWLIIGR